jgi:hypothetical protein
MGESSQPDYLQSVHPYGLPSLQTAIVRKIGRSVINDDRFRSEPDFGFLHFFCANSRTICTKKMQKV